MTDPFHIAAATALGLLWGSFLNVAVYRLPQTEVGGFGAGGRALSFLAWPRSFCPRCGEMIPAWRNIPVVSYAAMFGKAPCCGSPVSVLYPLGEILGAVVVVWPLTRFGVGVDSALAFVFLSALFVASGIDLHRRWLPDILTLPLLWLGLLANIDARFATLPDAVLGAAGGYLGMRILAGIFGYAVRRRAMGGGDFKLLAALGAWLGWQELPFLIFIASLLSLACSLAEFLFFRKRRGRGKLKSFLASQIPFGPFISAAGALMLFYGDEIVFAYWDFIGRT